MVSRVGWTPNHVFDQLTIICTKVERVAKMDFRTKTPVERSEQNQSPWQDHGTLIGLDAVGIFDL